MEQSNRFVGQLAGCTIELEKPGSDGDLERGRPSSEVGVVRRLRGTVQDVSVIVRTRV